MQGQRAEGAGGGWAARGRSTGGWRRFVCVPQPCTFATVFSSSPVFFFVLSLSTCCCTWLTYLATFLLLFLFFSPNVYEHARTTAQSPNEGRSARERRPPRCFASVDSLSIRAREPAHPLASSSSPSSAPSSRAFIPRLHPAPSSRAFLGCASSALVAHTALAHTLRAPVRERARVCGRERGARTLSSMILAFCLASALDDGPCCFFGGIFLLRFARCVSKRKDDEEEGDCGSAQREGERRREGKRGREGGREGEGECAA